MAARSRKIRHTDEVRAKIQTSQLINRLTDHAFSKIELEPSQVKSIEILLRKTLPDLSATDHSGEIAMPAVPVDRAPRETREQWLERKQREFLRVVTPAGAAE
jgi:hypothetical protein